MIEKFFTRFVDILLTASGFLPFLYDISKKILSPLHWEDNELLVSLLCSFIYSLFDTLIQLPWDYYDDFVIEEK